MSFVNKNGSNRYLGFIKNTHDELHVGLYCIWSSSTLHVVEISKTFVCFASLAADVL